MSELHFELEQLSHDVLCSIMCDKHRYPWGDLIFPAKSDNMYMTVSMMRMIDEDHHIICLEDGELSAQAHAMGRDDTWRPKFNMVFSDE